MLSYFYFQLVAINEMEFHYQDKVHPISYVTNTVSNMRVYFSRFHYYCYMFQLLQLALISGPVCVRSATLLFCGNQTAHCLYG
jgi:hypothetical protein